MPRCLDDLEPDITADMKAAYYGPDDYEPGDGPPQDRWPGNDRGTAWPATRDLEIAGLYLALARIDATRLAFHADPMSAYAPGADFAEDWDRRERRLLARLHARGRLIGDAAAVRTAAVRLEAWMP